MKQTKFSKVVSVVIVVAMMMLSAVTSFAEPSVGGKQDITTTKITVTGVSEAFDKVGVAISLLLPGATKTENKWDDTKVVDLGQAFVNEDGTYTYVFTLADDAISGTYILVATANDMAEGTVFFASPNERKGSLKAILVAGEDAATIATIVDTKIDVLGIDEDLWALLDPEGDESNTAAELDAAAMIAANEVLGDIDPEYILDTDLGVAAAEIEKEIFTAALNAGAVEDLADYDSFLPKEANDIYNTLTETEKATYKSYISSNGYDGAEKMATDAVTKAKIVAITSDNTDAEKVQEYIDGFNLDSASEFKGLTDLQKKNVLAAVKDAGPKTVSSLNSNLTTEVAKYLGGSTGQGSSSGSGGSSTTVTGPSGSSDKDEEEEKDEPVTPPAEEEIKYIDLAGYAWAEEAIYELSNKRILAGYGGGIFNPANLINRAEFAKVAVVAIYGEDAVNANVAPSFADAKGDWYTPYIGYAEKEGLINGISETEFGVSGTIKRQDIMTILYRIMLAKGYSANTTPIAYGDADSIADYAKDAVFALANAGVVSGYEDGSVRPAGNATRAEAAVLLSKFMKLF